MLKDGLSILLDSARLMGKSAPAYLAMAMLGGILLAALAWWAAVNYTRLWNLRFHPTPLHHALCGLAAFLTLVFFICFVSLGFAKDAAAVNINKWRDRVIGDKELVRVTSIAVHNAVKDSGLEIFGPNDVINQYGGSYPVTREETRRLTSTIYLRAAVEDFRKAHPYLHHAVWKKTSVPYERVLEDRNAWNSSKSRYPIERYFLVAAKEINDQLGPQTPRVVSSARRWLAALFLFAQAIPFGLIGWAAYRDLQERY